MTRTKLECNGMTLFKEQEGKIVKVASFEHGMDDEMNLLLAATELLEALEGALRFASNYWDIECAPLWVEQAIEARRKAKACK